MLWRTSLTQHHAIRHNLYFEPSLHKHNSHHKIDSRVCVATRSARCRQYQCEWRRALFAAWCSSWARPIRGDVLGSTPCCRNAGCPPAKRRYRGGGIVVYIYIYICICIHIYIYIYIYMYVCMYACMYIYIYIYIYVFHCISLCSLSAYVDVLPEDEILAVDGGVDLTGNQIIKDRYTGGLNPSLSGCIKNVIRCRRSRYCSTE